MADWPRVILPEDRVKYLVNARHDFKEEAKWIKEGKGYRVFLESGEGIVIEQTMGYPGLDSDEQVVGYDAWYLPADETPQIHLGFYLDTWEARKGATDEYVVMTAVQQAWEDVGA